MRVLITGGAGYIGSHTVINLAEAGHELCVVDNLSNSDIEAINRVSRIAGVDVPLHRVDIRDEEALTRVVTEFKPQACIHFAGLKAVGESVSEPGRYYDNNVQGTLVLLRALAEADCFTLVFSSSATVYGLATEMPLREDAPLQATNPYGWSKLMIEQILRDHAVADDRWRIALLRYFNPVGAHESGLIGEDPAGIPNNLMPFIAQVATGKLSKLRVFGDDYDTCDGTGVRDYIHVVDLAAGHLAALDALAERPGCNAWNLGTGQGTSVLQMVDAFQHASGVDIAYEIVDRRPGDVATSYACPRKAATELDWKATRTIGDMCVDTWRWQSQNPNGYNAS